MAVSRATDQVVCRVRFGRTLDIPFKTDIVLRNARRDRINAASVRQIAPLIAAGESTPAKSCPPAETRVSPTWRTCGTMRGVSSPQERNPRASIRILFVCGIFPGRLYDPPAIIRARTLYSAHGRANPASARRSGRKGRRRGAPLSQGTEERILLAFAEMRLRYIVGGDCDRGISSGRPL